MALVIMLNKEGFLGFFSFQPDASVQFIHKIPLLIFVIIALVVTFFAVVKQWSIIPVIGLLINLYLMTELGITNWMRFLVWLVIGLALYFSYGYWKSKLRNAS
jgi:hypothetical protein